VNHKITAIVVTFNPDIECLHRLILATLQQTAVVILVDNGSINRKAIENIFTAEMLSSERARIIYLDSNIGLAAAQNIGISKALELDASHVILFDQDSLPTQAMVAQLIQAEQSLLNSGINLAGVGPCYLDDRQDNPPPFISIKGLRLIRHPCTNNAAPIEVDYLIASGFLIRAKALAAVGLMRADFFIDYIDIEWGLRAKAMGYRSYGVCAAKMAHSLGDEPKVFLGKNIPMHSPLRHYYHFRNAVRLYLEPGIPLNWKLVDGWRLFLKFGFYSLFAQPRLEQCSSMLAGVKDAILGRGGQRQ
jgi:rhamnosyltransferase